MDAAEIGLKAAQPAASAVAVVGEDGAVKAIAGKADDADWADAASAASNAGQAFWLGRPAKDGGRPLRRAAWASPARPGRWWSPRKTYPAMWPAAGRAGGGLLACAGDARWTPRWPGGPARGPGARPWAP